MTYLPEGYEVPKSGGGKYLKFKQGANRFRILSKPVMGWEYWNKEDKPVRVEKYPEVIPADMRTDEKIKHFWALAVWNYTENAVQILEITQATIQGALSDLIGSPEWGDPRGYDVTVIRKGEKLETEYTVQPAPPKELPEEIRLAYTSAAIDLTALFVSGEPFTKEAQPEEITFDVPTVKITPPDVVKRQMTEEEEWGTM